MSTNNHGPNPEERNRMVDAALKDFYLKHGDGPPSPERQCYLRAKGTMMEVNRQIHDVLKAAKMAGQPFDPDMCHATLAKLMLDAFRQWSKDDLLFILAVLQSGIVMDIIKDEVNAGLV